MPRLRSAALAILGTLGIAGCGTSAYSSAVRVTVADPSGLFGDGELRVGVFDPSKGDTRDWAEKSIVNARVGAEVTAEVTSVETRAGGGDKPAREVRVGLYLPDYREFGWYELRLQPKDGQVEQVEAHYIAWDGYAAGADSVSSLMTTVTAEASGKTWKLGIRATLGEELPDERFAIEVDDGLTLDLVAAAEAGRLDDVQRLLIKGAKVNGARSDGRTALVVTTAAGNLDVARYLIQSGADVNLKDKAGLTAFLLSTMVPGDDPMLLVAMMNGGARLTATDVHGNTGLHLAAAAGNADIARRLVVNGVAVDALNASGRTALAEAVAAGRCETGLIETVRMLVEAKADVNLSDAAGRTPLAAARENRCEPISAILEQAGAR